MPEGLSPTQPLDLERLAKVLGRVRSTNDPEALASARLADRMVREAGVSWDAVIGSGALAIKDGDSFGALQVIEHPQRGRLAPPVGRRWVDSLTWLCSRRAGRSDIENRFLDGLCQKLNGQHGYDAPWITAPQAAWVHDIYGAIVAAGATR